MAALAAIAVVARSESPAPASGTETVATISRVDRGGLTQDYVAFRASQIGNIRYRLHVGLDPALPEYAGGNRIAKAP